MTPVVVVGGGMAGLAVAYELARRGAPFVLLERRGRLGGLVLSERAGEFVLDAGPDSLLVQKPDSIRLCDELGLGSRLVPTKPPRVSYVQRGGRLHALPEFSIMGIPTSAGPLVRSRLFSWAGKARMGAELFVPARRDDEDESIGSFMTRRFGAEATAYLAEPLLAGIHAGDVDRLSMAALFPRFVEAERTHGSLLRAFRRERTVRARPQGPGPFRTLPGGLSEIIDAVARTLPARSVRLNTTATRVARDAAGSGYVVTTTGGETLPAAAVVLATPAFVAAGLLRDFDPELARLCDGIAYVSTVTLSLAFPRAAVAHPMHGTGFVVPRAEGSDVLAVSWMSSKWPDRAPADQALLRVYLGGARHPDVLQHADADLEARAIRVLRPLLGISGPPVLARAYRWERAIAQHEVGHLARVAGIERRAAEWPGLHLTGSAYRAGGLASCIADGRRAGMDASALLVPVLSASKVP